MRGLWIREFRAREFLVLGLGLGVKTVAIIMMLMMRRRIEVMIDCININSQH